MFLTILIPAFNEEVNLRTHLPSILEKAALYARDFEVLVVDDGSTDSTAAVVEGFQTRDGRIRLIRHPQNLGPGSGVKTGIREARGDWIIFIPADIAIDLDHLPRYIAAAEHADVVVGLRSDRRDYSLRRKFSSVVYIGLVKLLFAMPQRQFNYVHMYRRAIFEKFDVEYGSVFITAEICIKARDAGFRLTEVEIGYVPREHGEAAGGKPKVIARATRDLFHYWWRWRFSRKKTAGS
ncbi:MAG: glycosyltransferase family 2 protein [Deltaproteobacteria bacterium]|nr:glycosyltransferase family 2 protein [Deltaproteobacteria bacterium]